MNLTWSKSRNISQFQRLCLGSESTKNINKKLPASKNNKGPLYSFKLCVFSSPTGLPPCLIRSQYVRVIACCVDHHYLYEMAVTLALRDNGIPCPQIKQSELTTVVSLRSLSLGFWYWVLSSSVELPTSTPNSFQNSTVCSHSLANEK